MEVGIRNLVWDRHLKCPFAKLEELSVKPLQCVSGVWAVDKSVLAIRLFKATILQDIVHRKQTRGHS